MAREGNISINLRVSKNGAAITQNASTTFDVSGSQLIQSTQNIGTTAELLDFGGITGAPQAVMVKNLDATNYVEIGGDSGLTVFSLKVPAGQTIFFNPTSSTVYAKANTAAVNVIILASEA